jgi:hypothetical protein
VNENEQRNEEEEQRVKQSQEVMLTELHSSIKELEGLS